MRRVAYALIASGALMLGALTSASAGDCYGDGCYDGGYRSYHSPSYERYERYSERPVYYHSYYRNDCRGGGDCYYDGPHYRTTYYARPYYGYHDDYNDGYRPYYRNTCEHGYGDCGYRSTGYCGHGCSYRHGGCGYGYDYGCGYRHSYGYGYGYPYHSTVRYGGAWMQTGPAYASWGGGWHGGGWGGCRTAYIPYGWTWYRATSC